MKVGQALRAVSYRLAVQYKSAGSPRNAAVMATNSADQSRPFLDQSRIWSPSWRAMMRGKRRRHAGEHINMGRICAACAGSRSPFDIRATPVFILYYQEPCDALVTRAL